MVRKLRPQARDVNQPPEPNRSAWRPAGVEMFSRGRRYRLPAERTEAGVPLPMALLVKLDRLAEALHFLLNLLQDSSPLCSAGGPENSKRLRR
jgi:hypothetical protein